MTCIIGLKDENKIYLGSDSCISGAIETIIGIPKILRRGEFLLGGAGSLRGLQLFQYSMSLPNIYEGEDIYHYLINTLTHNMRQTFKTHGFLYEKDKHEMAKNLFLVVFRGEIYQFDGSFAVTHSRENYTAIGCGTHFALGSLHATAHTNFDPETRIKLALDVASKYDGFVSPPYDILSIEWDGYENGDAYRFFDDDGTTKEDKLVNDKPKEEKDVEPDGNDS